MPPSKADKAPTKSDHYCLGTVARPQLLHDMFDMDFDRLLCYKESSSDVTISMTVSEFLEHFSLALRQVLLA